MQVILLERIAKLGQMGDQVRVRDGYARNFLLPQGKALRATPANQERFEAEKSQLEARNLERRKEAESVAAKMEGVSLVVIRQAAATGQLYGSVSTRDIADDLTAEGYAVNRTQIELTTPIKTIGIHSVAVRLHPEVEVPVEVNVARSADEAERQARGEDMIQRDDRFEFEPEDEEDGEDGAELSADDAADEAGTAEAESPDAEAGDEAAADEAEPRT